jgi:hypothetical protein
MLHALRAAAVAAAIAGAAAAQATWYVDAGHPGCPGSGTPGDPFCTIAAGIAAASPGDTIEVAPGTYAESVAIDKDDLTLRGAGAALTAIVGDPASHVVGPAGPSVIARFRIEGFRITTSDPGASGLAGVRADPQLAAGAAWHVDGCVIEGLEVGIQAINVFPGGEVLVEDTVIADCVAGVHVYGETVTIRNCTIAGMESYGVQSEVGGSHYTLENSIVADTGAWAAMRSHLDTWSIRHVLVFDSNLDNPPYAPEAGPFVEYIAEGNGFWITVAPGPGPVVEADPQFVDPGAGDLRIPGGSPAVDAGDPATSPDREQPYDVEGFGHPRVQDGDFDGVARVDLGAHEFGGFLTAGGEAVGATLSGELWGPANAQYGVFVGVLGPPLDLGPKGTLFLDTSPLLLVLGGGLPPNGHAQILQGVVPPALAGLDFGLQVLTRAPGPSGALDWTSLEHVSVAP